MSIHRVLVSIAVLFSCTAVLAAQAPDSVTFRGGAGSISSNVSVPANRAVFYSSGTLGGVADSTAPAGTRARYGDTKTQGMSALRNIEKQLMAEKLSLTDVVLLRVYVAPDPMKGGQWDWQGWFDAYAEFFNRPSNPVKTARSTIGVGALVRPEYLIEIEAVAVYPAK